MKTYGFEKLEVWNDAKELAVKIYALTSTFPDSEKYCLSNQMRRAIISVSSNIAEGSSRNSTKDQAHFYSIAYSSLIEVLSQTLISYELGFVKKVDVELIRNEIEKVSNKLNALKKSLRI